MLMEHPWMVMPMAMRVPGRIVRRMPMLMVGVFGRALPRAQFRNASGFGVRDYRPAGRLVRADSVFSAGAAACSEGGPL
jgi:hypothetical protein